MLTLALGCTRTGASGAPIDFTPTATPGLAPAPALPAPGAETETAGQGAAGLALLEQPPERLLYTLNVVLDYENSMLNTQEKVEFRNPTGQPVTELKFNVPPARRPDAIVVRDARIFGQSQPLKFTLADTVLTVNLPAPLPPDAGIAIAFDYALHIPLQESIDGIGGDDSSRGPYSLMAGHWYIMLAPYQDGEWNTPAYVPVGDSYVSDVADYEVNILAPDDIIIAGAGEEQRDGRLWRYSLPQARVFAFGASPVFQVDSIEQDGVTYIHYTYPKHRKVTEAVLYTAARAVKLFSQLYGPYPYKVFRIVETGRSQGQEYSGMVGIGTLLYNGYPGRGSRHDLIATVVHETAHQWWYHVVGNDQVRTPWLDESFARMNELQFYEKYYPRDVGWWRKQYLGTQKTKGAIDLPISAYEDTRDYIRAVYQRGLVFLEQLRSLVGKDVFLDVLRDYYATLSYQTATPQAFFDALSRHTDQDLTDLVGQYFATDTPLPCKISNNLPGCRE